MARCVSPIRIRNPSKYDFKRRWKPYVDVPCGKCLYCLQRRSNGFAFRITCELLCSKFNPLFVTLTYDDFNLPYAYPVIGLSESSSSGETDMFGIFRGGDIIRRKERYSVDDGRSVLYREDFTRFLKRLRSKVPVPLRYFGCGEYGDPAGVEVGRPHYHFILWSHSSFVSYNDLWSAITLSWNYGHVFIENVCAAHTHYVAKYCAGKYFTDNPFHNEKSFRTFIACSKGLGKCYLTNDMKRYIYEQINNSSLTRLFVNGEHFSMPRYIKDTLNLSYAQREKYNNQLLEAGIKTEISQLQQSGHYSSVGSMLVDHYSDFERKTYKKLKKRSL